LPFRVLIPGEKRRGWDGSEAYGVRCPRGRRLRHGGP
jgi:hypothetical protein